MRFDSGWNHLGPPYDSLQMLVVGRMEENWSEDPHLVSEYGVAAVLGLQGPINFPNGPDNFAGTYLHDPSRHVTSQASSSCPTDAGALDR